MVTLDTLVSPKDTLGFLNSNGGNRTFTHNSANLWQRDRGVQQKAIGIRFALDFDRDRRLLDDLTTLNAIAQSGSSIYAAQTENSL
jgi:hypothetical protein